MAGVAGPSGPLLRTPITLVEADQSQTGKGYFVRVLAAVHSPKTEHDERKESRQIPIFPELCHCLEQAWEDADPGTEYDITRYRDGNVNLRTQLERIIRKAGLKGWPKPWQQRIICKRPTSTSSRRHRIRHSKCSQGTRKTLHTGLPRLWPVRVVTLLTLRDATSCEAVPRVAVTRF